MKKETVQHVPVAEVEGGREAGVDERWVDTNEEPLNDEYEPEKESGRFIAFFECTDTHCREVVAATGNYSTSTRTQVDLETDEEEAYEVTHYSPSSMHPAPPIISAPKQLNDECRSHLAIAHELFWVELASCASRLRILVEALLDQLEIPRIGRKGKSENARLDLSDRIALLSATRPGHDEALTALRNVGNVASHEGKIDLAFMLDCFDILESAMDELLGRRSENRAERTKLIIDTKGKRVSDA